MKQTIHLFGIAALLFIWGMGGCSHSNPTLTSVEQLMDERPDSALAILQGMDTLTLKSSEEKALYSLLSVQTRYKNHVDVQDTAQIQAAVDFYADSKDDYHKMLAYYYLARVEENRHKYSMAIVNLLKAETAAKKIPDYFYLGMIYRSFSDIYNCIFNGVEGVKYAQKAYECFQKSGHTLHADWGLLDIGRSFHNGEDYDNSVEVLQKVADIASAKQDTVLWCEALKLLATSGIGKRDYGLTRRCYGRIIKLDAGRMTLDDYRNLGIAYLKTGQMDSAQYYMDRLASADSTQGWLPYLWNKRQGNYQEALLALEKENSYNNKVLHEVINQNVTEAVSNYHHYEMQEQKQELMRIKRNVAVFFIILLLVAIIVMQHISSQKKKIENNMLLASNLRNLLTVKETEAREMRDAISRRLENQQMEHEALQKAIDKLFEQHFATIDKLSSAYYEYQGTANEKHKIYADVMKLVSGLGSDKQTLEELERFVNTYRNNLMSRFREAFPDMKESDSLLYLYSVAGFSPRAISIFIGEKLEVVYNRKSRLKQKINRSLSPEKESFLQYM